MGIPQLKLMDEFSPSFQDMFTQQDQKLIRFWRVSGNGYCHGNAFKIIQILNLWVSIA